MIRGVIKRSIYNKNFILLLLFSIVLLSLIHIYIIRIAATKISAGVSTGIGSHSEEIESEKGDEQFEIADTRDVNEVFEAIKSGGLQPVCLLYTSRCV